jgi:SAM-dependent methyltransferase
VTNVAVQNRIAARLDAAAGVADRMAHLEADYTRTGLPAAQADGAWAVESACYAEGTAKADFVREAARLLKPGARLAVVDGFLLRREPGRLPAGCTACGPTAGPCPRWPCAKTSSRRCARTVSKTSR